MTSFTRSNQVLIQGITEPLGLIYTQLIQAYGTNVVAGISPGGGGQRLQNVPVFDLVETAIATVGTIDTSIIFTAPCAVLDAALEAIAANIRQLILVTAGIPALDMVTLLQKAAATQTLILGCNSPGIIVPGEVLLGTHSSEFYTPGSVGLISRSGCLAAEIALELTEAGLGQSISVSIGNDAIVGSSFPQWLQYLNEDAATEVIVLAGEVGGDAEEEAAHYIAEAINKPVIAYVAGRTAPQTSWGRAGAKITAQLQFLSNAGTAASKISAFERYNIPVADRPSQIPILVEQALRRSTKQAS